MICSQCNHRGVRHTAVEFAMAAFERLAHIAKELRSARQNAERLSSGKRQVAADALGISRKNLWEKLRAHGITDANDMEE